jgi:GTP cyclohydrolase I
MKPFININGHCLHHLVLIPRILLTVALRVTYAAQGFIESRTVQVMEQRPCVQNAETELIVPCTILQSDAPWAAYVTRKATVSRIRGIKTK